MPRIRQAMTIAASTARIEQQNHGCPVDFGVPSARH
jgi:hypothetical protein